MSETTVTEALGELLPPSQVTTYLPAPPSGTSGIWSD